MQRFLWGFIIYTAVGCGVLTAATDNAFADDQPAAEASASTPPATPTLLPAMSGPLTANAKQRRSGGP